MYSYWTILDFWSSETGDENFCCFKAQLVAIYYNDDRKLIDHGSESGVLLQQIPENAHVALEWEVKYGMEKLYGISLDCLE